MVATAADALTAYKENYIEETSTTRMNREAEINGLAQPNIHLG